MGSLGASPRQRPSAKKSSLNRRRIARNGAQRRRLTSQTILPVFFLLSDSSPTVHRANVNSNGRNHGHWPNTRKIERKVGKSRRDRNAKRPRAGPFCRRKRIVKRSEKICLTRHPECFVRFDCVSRSTNRPVLRRKLLINNMEGEKVVR